MTAAPQPPGGVGDDPPDLANLLYAVRDLLTDIWSDTREISGAVGPDRVVRLVALRAVVHRYLRDQL
jgi:hypothetical protein